MATYADLLILKGSIPGGLEYYGGVDCSNENLTSLEGSPCEIKESFYCSGNYLKTLEGGPSVVGRGFYCSNNQLESLKGGPTFVGNDFTAHNNKLKNLDFAPFSINGHVCVNQNEIASLHNIHKSIKRINGTFDLVNNPITSNVLGLLLIHGLIEVYLDNQKLQKIINNHLSGHRDVFECQEELINANLDDFAKL